MRTSHLRGTLFLIKFLKNKVTKKISLKRKALQACSIHHLLHHLHKFLKRVPLRWLVSASVSIEASIAIPVFLFAFLEIISLLNCLSVYSGMLYNIKIVSDPISMYAYAYDTFSKETEITIGEQVVTSLVFSEGYLESQIRKRCRTNLYEQAIDGGIDKVSFLGSQINREKQFVSVLAKYETNPIIKFSGIKIPMQQYYYVRMWTGYNRARENTSEGTVYITKTGRVYHTFRDCSHLVLSIRSIPKEEVKKARNEDGEPYTNCPMCLEIVEKEERLESFYITLTGNKYHGNLSCSALKRTILTVPLEEVKDRDLCMRCLEREVK